MAGLAFTLYALGGFATADGLANLNTTGHAYGLELFIGLTALFVGGMVHLINNNRNN